MLKDFTKMIGAAFRSARPVATLMAGAAAVTLSVSSASAVPIVRGTGDAALIKNDLTDLGNNGVEGGYVDGASVPPAVLSGFDARFFASSEAAFGGGENAYNVFDNLTGGGNNKWCCQGVTEAVNDTAANAFQFVGADFSQTLAAGGGTGIQLNRFTMTSSNDTPGRDPDVWAIQGSNDGIAWTNIFSFSATGTGAAGVAGLWGTTRNQVLEFSVANGDFALPGLFDQFRLFVDSTSGAGVFALSELELFGDIITTPEPATATLGALALGGLMMRRRRTA